MWVVFVYVPLWKTVTTNTDYSPHPYKASACQGRRDSSNEKVLFFVERLMMAQQGSVIERGSRGSGLQNPRLG